jgi:CIC family chloride channel protein
MLTLGSQLGLAFGLAATALIPGLPMDPRGFALVGMAAFFAGVVRAPLTGIALVIEMTGDTGMLLPVLAGCFIAMLVPTWLGNPPIYDSLKERTLRDTAALRTPSPPAA